MKSKKLFLCIISLLLTNLLPAKVYADQSSQSMGNGNICSPQSNGNNNSYECNVHIHNYPSENIPDVNQPNRSTETTETTESTYSHNAGGYKPEQSPPLRITNSSGYKPEQSPPLRISSPSGYKPEQSLLLRISKP